MQRTTFTLAEAAQLLSCHKETLRRAILDGSLLAAKLGRGYRISKIDLQKFWMEKGGGELFAAEELAAALEQRLQPEAPSAKKGHPKEPQGPHQLTLPSL